MRRLILISVCCMHFTAFSQDTIATEQDNASSNLPHITKKKAIFYWERMNPTFYLDNGQVYKEEQLKLFLMEQNLPYIWTQYLAGKRAVIMGEVLSYSGCAVAVVGIILEYWGGSATRFAPSFIVAGGLLCLAGIPVEIVGFIRRNDAIRDYNTWYAGKPRPQYSQNVTYKIGLVGNGLGFSLNF